jgi:hypothetical protein
MFEVDYYQQFLDGSQLGVTHDFNNPGFTFTANNRFQFSKSFSCSLNLTAQTDYDDDSHHNKGYYSASAWVRKSFFDNRLAISLSARDIFRSEKERWDGYGAGGIRNRKDCYNYTQMVSLTVTYMFNYRSRKYKGTGAGNAEKQRL